MALTFIPAFLSYIPETSIVHKLLSLSLSVGLPGGSDFRDNYHKAQNLYPSMNHFSHKLGIVD